MLYFIKSSNFLKIGYTRTRDSLIKRIKSYRTYNPDFSILLITQEGSSLDESKLHHMLNDYKFYSEWFYNTPRVHEIWNNYTKDMNKIDIDDIVSESIDREKYQENKIENIKKDLQIKFGEVSYFDGYWDIKDVMFPIYRKYGKKECPTLSDLEIFGYGHKRVHKNGKACTKIYKIIK